MADELAQLREKLKTLTLMFHLDTLAKELSELDQKIAVPNFWNDRKGAAQVQRRRSQITEILKLFEQLKSDLNDIEEFKPLAEQGDADLQKEVSDKSARVRKTMDDLEFRRLLGGEMDHSSAILTINSGAGGTESQDWVAMLLRMYLRWAENHNYKVTIADQLAGEEAGLKNATVLVDGACAYGYLKSETGVHRLVRISPFDSNSRRHTSFASVLVMPQVEDDVEIEVRDEDLRVDTYRSSGAGGQHVNKTDSAVRLTHIPSGIVVACQNERSQHKNKAQAMKILKSRLFEKQLEEREKEKAKIAGEKKFIDFGSQIRSYVLQPYQLVKDLRTDLEIGNVQAVLDGEIDGFIRAYLLQKATTQSFDAPLPSG